ncbi:MAG: alpha/beta fold hydrolase [Bacteroidota bacterium]
MIISFIALLIRHILTEVNELAAENYNIYNMIEKTPKLVTFVALFFFLIPSHWANGQDGSGKEHAVVNIELQFPENWKSKTGRKITLPIKIFKTTNENPSSPIFWLNGGPGQSNLDYNPPPELLENHDIILMGYRGVDGSVQLECPEVNSALKGTGNDLLSKESVGHIIGASKECANRLMNDGIDLNGFTIEQVLFDISAVCKHLNLEKINLLSASYGTRVALLYGKFYPEDVHRSVMIGANPPGNFVWEPTTIACKIRDYDLICQKNAYCQGKTKDLTKTIEKVLQEMPDYWWFVPIDPGKVKVVSFGMLYHSDTAKQVIDAFLAASEGDYSGIALMSIAYDYVLPNMMVWGDFLSKGMIDYDPSRNYWEEFTADTNSLGSPMSALFMDVGSAWPVEQPSREYSKIGPSSVSTLVLSGGLDFSTPHEIAQKELMPLLSNGKQVVFEGKGHVSDLLYRTEIKQGIKDYFLTGMVAFQKLEGFGTFKVDNGFPKIAKISLAVLVLVSLLIVFFCYKLGRKLLARKGHVRMFKS